MVAVPGDLTWRLGCLGWQLEGDAVNSQKQIAYFATHGWTLTRDTETRRGGWLFGPTGTLASYCFARHCAAVDYRVMDPATVKVISRQNADDECDARCAEKALGVQLPEELGAQL